MLRKFTPSPAMAVAVTALVMAGAGTGYAAVTLPAKSVGTKQLRNNAVTTAKLKKNSVSASKLQAGSVTARELAGGAVGANQIAPDSLTGGQINEGTIGTVSSATTAGSAPVQGLTYPSTHVALPAGMGIQSHIDCPPDRRPLAGGARMDDPINEFIVDEFPQGNGWTVSAGNPSPDDSGFTIYVTCAQAQQGTPAAPKVQAKATTSRFRVAR